MRHNSSVKYYLVYMIDFNIFLFKPSISGSHIKPRLIQVKSSLVEPCKRTKLSQHLFFDSQNSNPKHWVMRTKVQSLKSTGIGRIL